MFVDSVALESEVFRHIGKVGSTVDYVKAAFGLFLTNPVVTSEGRLYWPDSRFVSSISVVKKPNTSTYGYNPLPCMLRALNRLDDNAKKTSVVYDEWIRESTINPNVRSFKTGVLEKLFVEGVPAVHVESFTAVESINIVRIKTAVIGTARCMRNVAPSYRWLNNTYVSWMGILRLYSEEENMVVQACRRAAGIHRRTRRCNDTITVKSEPRKWQFEWSDCSLITFGDVTYYERRDERLKWISVLIWEYISGRLDKNKLPLCILFSMRSDDEDFKN